MSEAADIERAFHSLAPGEVDGAFLLSPSLRLNFSKLTIALAAEANLPVQAHRREWVEQGALFSLGVDVGPVGAAAARFVDAILKGTPPADLPVEEVPRIEFAISLKTSRGARHRGAAGRDRQRRQGLSVGEPRLERIEWLRPHGRITA